VQMIATMAMNLPALEDECRTTLIVVPAALLQQVSPLCTYFGTCFNCDQWKDEIETKSNNMFKVHIHHGKDKLKVDTRTLAHLPILTSFITETVSSGGRGCTFRFSSSICERISKPCLI